MIGEIARPHFTQGAHAAGKVHDPAVATALHYRNGESRKQQRTVHVGLHGIAHDLELLPGVRIAFFHHDTGVVDEYIEPAELFSHPVHALADALSAGDIELSRRDG